MAGAASAEGDKRAGPVLSTAFCPGHPQLLPRLHPLSGPKGTQPLLLGGRQSRNASGPFSIPTVWEQEPQEEEKLPAGISALMTACSLSQRLKADTQIRIQHRMKWLCSEKEHGFLISSLAVPAETILYIIPRECLRETLSMSVHFSWSLNKSMISVVLDRFQLQTGDVRVPQVLGNVLFCGKALLSVVCVIAMTSLVTGL